MVAGLKMPGISGEFLIYKVFKKQVTLVSIFTTHINGKTPGHLVL